MRQRADLKFCAYILLSLLISACATIERRELKQTEDLVTCLESKRKTSVSIQRFCEQRDNELNEQQEVGP